MEDVQITFPKEKNYHFGEILITVFLYGEKPNHIRTLKNILETYYVVASFEEKEGETRTLCFVRKMLSETNNFLDNVIEFNDYGVGFKAEEVVYLDEKPKYNYLEQTLWHIWDPIEIEDKYYDRKRS